MSKSTPLERVRIVIADDNKQIREMVVNLLAPDFEVVGAASDGAAAIEMVILLDPEIVVLDISMPNLNGIETAARLKKRGSQAKTVFLTVHEDQDFVRAAMGCGASGYVVKSRMATDLHPAIRAATEDKLFISPTCAFSIDPFGN